MYCPYCGQVISNNSKFCMFCGKEIDIIPPSEKMTSPINKPENIIPPTSREESKTILELATEEKNYTTPPCTAENVPIGVHFSPDEKTVWRGKMSMSAVVGIIISGIVLIILGLLIAASIWTRAIGIVFIFLGILSFVIAILQQHATDYLITNKRVYIRYGIVGRKISDLDSKWITNTFVEQSFGGRMLNYGNVVVSTPGEYSGAPVMKGVKDPLQIKYCIERYVMKRV